MADVTSKCQICPQKSKPCYFPTLPPSPSKVATSYTKAVMAAPMTALMGVVVDGRQPDRFDVTPRCRMRKQVGNTNRWRLPESLGSDLLGSNQAIRAIKSNFNDSMMHIITAEGPMNSLNMDMSQPYSFRVVDDRPKTMGSAPDVPNLSKLSSQSQTLTNSNSGPLPPATAPVFTRHVRGVGPLKTFVPSRARPASALDVFLYHSKKSGNVTGPDVLLKCLDMSWELHRPYLRKAGTLSLLIQGATPPKPQMYYREKTSDTLDEYIKKNNFYSNPAQEGVNLSSDFERDQTEIGLNHPKHISEKRLNNMTVIELEIDDPLITKNALAITLGNLYHDEMEIDKEELVGVMAAAYHLKFRNLMEGCVASMLKTITARSVCAYHEAALKYKQDQVINATERWLELNLIPQLSTQIQLRQLPMVLLQKILQTHRLFVFNEYAPYKVLAYWLFLQLNPEIQLMPSLSTVISYFNNLPKANALIERQEGQYFSPLFSALRLHGILDTNNIKDMQQMNIIPQSWIIKVLTQHYHALQAGGDMVNMNNFDLYAVRQGFVIDDEPHYHSEILSLHGFHFELKAIKQKLDNSYSFFMQRLKPSDPILSFRQCERQTFSMRADREVKYCIRVQTIQNGDYKFHSTGVITHKFGLGSKTSKSEVLKLVNVSKPLYVSYCLLFPPS
ncbi:BTB/POZ domain-containing protein 16-like [Lineus longissimus]|uniref:BTB/POZ domain-containing protein 16-like n=1 Tax=Lineus longissimus TaxID=88925 RepID=UPI00315D2D3E